MRTTIYSANLAASTKTANIMIGDINEFVTEEADVSIYMVSSATGVRASIYADGDLIVDDKEIPFIGTSVDTSAHFFTEFAVAAGTRLAIFLRETSGVATTDVYTVVDVE